MRLRIEIDLDKFGGPRLWMALAVIREWIADSTMGLMENDLPMNVTHKSNTVGHATLVDD